MQTLGIDVGGTNIAAALVQAGNTYDIRTIPVIKSGSRDDVLHQLVQLISQYTSQGFEAIGVGVPSYVDVTTGTVYDTVNLPGWDEVPLRQILQDKFHVPVWVENDSNCFALGEKQFGQCQAHESIIGLTLGTGVGSGVIIENKIHYGLNGCAGEVGGLPFRDKVYEYYAGHSFFSEIHHTTALDVFTRAEHNDPQAKAIFHQYGGYVGAVVNLVLMTYDPEAIVLGGSISKAWKYFEDGLYETVRKNPFRQLISNMTIYTSELENAGILGAAYLALQEIKPVIINS